MKDRIWKAQRILIMILLLFGGAPRVFAQCDPATYGANPNDNVADDWAIQQCLNQGGTTNLHSGAPGYQITNTLEITVPGTSLVGVDSARAHVVANTMLDSSAGKRILAANNVDNVTLSNVYFDGNKDSRDTGPCGQTFEYGKNILVVGNGFRLLNIMSANALCGSAAEIQGGGFEVANSYFRENGYPADQGGPWSDGLTVWACNGGSSIHDSSFLNNTDVDLVVGGGDGGSCSVTNNTIENTTVHAFAGLHVGWFPGGNANHSGITYSGNTISSGLNLLAFGLMVGFHPWGSSQQLVSAGLVSSNSITGAVINLQVEADSTGVATGTVTGNTVSNAQGSFGLGSCTVSTNYGAYPPHGGVIAYDSGYLDLQFDDGQCTIR